MRPLALVLCATLAAHAAPAPLPRPDPNKEELQRLQGERQLTEGVDEGRRLLPASVSLPAA